MSLSKINRRVSLQLLADNSHSSVLNCMISSSLHLGEEQIQVRHGGVTIPSSPSAATAMKYFPGTSSSTYRSPKSIIIIIIELNPGKNPILSSGSRTGKVLPPGKEMPTAHQPLSCNIIRLDPPAPAKIESLKLKKKTFKIIKSNL